MVTPLQPEGWQTTQHILVILAHPDDPEFFCGATIARWTDAGHVVSYCLLTCGDKGTRDRQMSGERLCAMRHEEQKRAASLLGVHKVRFLDFPDGYLVPNLDLRKAITRVIRQERPQVVVTCDPQLLFVGDERINHPDHRAAGQAFRQHETICTFRNYWMKVLSRMLCQKSGSACRLNPTWYLTSLNFGSERSKRFFVTKVR